MTEKPLISVIIPVYNTQEYLRQCLDSVINQTYSNLEIITVNDGSTDNSLAILQEFASKDSRITVINKSKGGNSSARNAGIIAAKGEYVLNVDSDDWIEPLMCERLIEAAKKNDAQIVVCDVVFEFHNKSYIRKEPYESLGTTETFLVDYLLGTGLNSVCNKLVLLSLYKENNILHYTDIFLGEDSTALLRLITKVKNIAYINLPLYHYNKESAGVSTNFKNILQYYVGVSHVQDYYEQNNLDTTLFPLIKFKIAYSELVRYSLQKAYKLGYSDFPILAKQFISDIKNIKSVPEYKFYKMKYKLFINVYKWYYYLTPKKYK